MSSRPILLIEDNPDDEALTLRAFAKNGIANPLVVARDGVEAFDYLLPESEAVTPLRPALVLLDLKLPRIDGLELLRRLRADERTDCLPIVVLSTSNEKADIQAAYRLGANSYMRKPVDFDEFIAAVGHLGRYWLTLDILASAE